MSNVISEYWQDERKSVIRLTNDGFEVDLYENDTLLETRQLHEHSESYAESCAENYVQRVFNVVGNPNDVGYYGYNEKTDNFYPELDD